jgi:hypothetical protein
MRNRCEGNKGDACLIWYILVVSFANHRIFIEYIMDKLWCNDNLEFTVYSLGFGVDYWPRLPLLLTLGCCLCQKQMLEES